MHTQLKDSRYYCCTRSQRAKERTPAPWCTALCPDSVPKYYSPSTELALIPTQHVVCFKHSVLLDFRMSFSGWSTCDGARIVQRELRVLSQSWEDAQFIAELCMFLCKVHVSDSTRLLLLDTTLVLCFAQQFGQLSALSNAVSKVILTVLLGKYQAQRKAQTSVDDL